MLLANQQTDLGTAFDDALGTLCMKAIDDPQELLPRRGIQPTEAEFFIDGAIHERPVFVVGNQHREPALLQSAPVKLLLHRESRAEQPDRPDT
jgi:hypothetical protein